MTDEVVTELTSDECWEMLRNEEFGRLAYRLRRRGPHHPDQLCRSGRLPAVPHGRGQQAPCCSDRCPRWRLRSIATTRSRPAASSSGGTARLLPEDEAHRADNVPLRPWTTTLKYNVVEIQPKVVSGRGFELSRPWLHLRLHD